MAGRKRTFEAAFEPEVEGTAAALRRKLREKFNKFKRSKLADFSSSYKQVSAEELVESVLKCKPAFSTLLVDCRSPEDFQTRRINNSVNAPIADRPAYVNIFTVSSKSEAVKVFLKLCPQLLMYLYHPGYFTDIVLLAHCPDNVVYEHVLGFIMKALSVWNGDVNPKPNIWFLREGFSRFAAKFPEWICQNMEENGRPIPWSTRGGIIKFLEYQSVPTSTSNLSEDGAQLKDSLNAHLRSLKSAIQAATELRDLKLQKRSLEAVHSIIVEEGRDEINSKICALVPADVKCPVCYDVFSGQIFQCINGHCVCSTCCENLRSCPECRAPYYVNGGSLGKIRVRTLERLLASSVKVDCPDGCGGKLAYSQLEAHFHNCVKGKDADLKSMIRMKIELKQIEIESLNEDLEILNNEMLQQELRWNSKGISLVAGVPQALLEEMLTNKIELAKAQTALALDVFMKTPNRPQRQ